MAAAKKAPNPIDKHVGSRVRMRRIMLGMSQEKLGEALGLTFQQVQKYEKGTNRISAGRLQRIAAILEVPVSVFFADTKPSAGDAESLFDLVDTGSALRLLRAYARIPSPALKRALTSLAEEIAGEPR
jgi:transcriptional regulator with XRE-family HTH domain